MRWQLDFSGGQRGIDVFVGNWRNPVSLLLHWIQGHCRAQIKSKHCNSAPQGAWQRSNWGGAAGSPHPLAGNISLYSFSRRTYRNEVGVGTYYFIFGSFYRRPLVRHLVRSLSFRVGNAMLVPRLWLEYWASGTKDLFSVIWEYAGVVERKTSLEVIKTQSWHFTLRILLVPVSETH